MAAKDLYTILQVPPTATMVEIKKAYRKLALQYHPDKNPNDEVAANRFLEIKKAYEVLRNTAKRQQYSYENWQEKRKQSPNFQTVTAQSILQRTIDLAAHVSSIDIFRMSHDALYMQVKEILSEKNIAILQHASNNTINKKMIETVLKILTPLPFRLIEKTEPMLVKIAFTDNETIRSIHTYMKQKKRIAFWEKYNLAIIIIVTILICVIVFFAGKN